MFKVTARTVLELGSELISSDVIAFYELVKNGFDAGTKSGVEIRFDIVLGLRSEPPRDCRRPFGLNYAAMGVSSSMA